MSALYHLMVKTRMLLAKHQYFGSFLIKIGKFDPRGVHNCSRSVHVLDSFHPYNVLVCLEWFFMHVRHISSGQKCEKLHFQPFFSTKFCRLTPRGVQRKGYPLGYLYFFKTLLLIFQE